MIQYYCWFCWNDLIVYIFLYCDFFLLTYTSWMLPLFLSSYIIKMFSVKSLKKMMMLRHQCLPVCTSHPHYLDPGIHCDLVWFLWHFPWGVVFFPPSLTHRSGHWFSNSLNSGGVAVSTKILNNTALKAIQWALPEAQRRRRLPTVWTNRRPLIQYMWETSSILSGLLSSLLNSKSDEGWWSQVSGGPEVRKD